MRVTDDQILDYMEHFGVKGMHWGVRKAARKASSNANQNVSRLAREREAGNKALKKPKEDRTPEEKKAARNRTAEKVLKGALVAGVVASGALMARSILKENAAKKVRVEKFHHAKNRSDAFTIFNMIQGHNGGKNAFPQGTFDSLASGAFKNNSTGLRDYMSRYYLALASSGG